LNQAALQYEVALLDIDLDISGMGRRCEQESNEGEGQPWDEVAHDHRFPLGPLSP